MNLESKIELVKNSGFLVPDWYRQKYPDVDLSGLDPYVHYIKYGEYLGRQPSSLFSPGLYLRANPDIASYKHGLLVHYILFGESEGRSSGQDVDVIYTDFNTTLEKNFLKKMDRVRLPKRNDRAPFVSIIMPTWNRGSLILTAIDSVLEQDYGSFELLVCDDGSTDDTAEIVSNIARKDGRIKLLALPHGGVCAARNAGAEVAKGELIAYLDSDNTWYPNFLSTCVRFMESEKLDCCYSGMKVSSGMYRGRPFDWGDLVKRNYIDMNVFVHRRSLFKKVGTFDESLKRVVDWDLILRCTKVGKTRYAPFIGALYDDGQRDDRLTVSESNVWEHVVRNKHIFLPNISTSSRKPGTLSVILPIFDLNDTSRAQLDEFVHQCASAEGLDVELVLAYSKPRLKDVLSSYSDATVVALPERANPALFYNIAANQSRGETLLLTSMDVSLDSGWADQLRVVLSNHPSAKVLRGKVAARVRDLGVWCDVNDSGGGQYSCFPMLCVDAKTFFAVKGFNAQYQGALSFADLHMSVVKAGASYLQAENIRLSSAKLVYNPRVVENDKNLVKERWPTSSILRKTFDRTPRKIAIKISCPDASQKEQWGDYHFAVAMSRALEKFGFSVRIDFNLEWHRPESNEDDVVIALRGRHAWQPRKDQINFLWLISHPERVSDKEMESYDHVFVASAPHAETLARRLITPVDPLLQCTDPDRFYPNQPPPPHISENLFIGNSRNVFRPIVRDFINLGLPLDVYGANWAQYIPESYIRGENISNSEVARYYGNSNVVLNDHWDTMREYGFMSNRFFDAIAAGACILTDDIQGVEMFGNVVRAYSDPTEIPALLLELKSVSRAERYEMAEYIRKHHSFDARMQQMVTVIERIFGGKRSLLSTGSAS